MKNWWYYHKWYVICGTIVGGVIVYLLGNALGLFQKEPDIQIAYVSESPLPEDTVDALEKSFASLADDYNHDGEVLVQIHQYVSGDVNSVDAEDAYYRQASEISLVGDIDNCDSYFFLMDNPAELQRIHQILAQSDGSTPAELDYSSDDKAFLWTSFPALSGLDLGDYTTTILGQSFSGNSQELLADLYFGRRCFYTEKRCKYADECEKLWQQLKGDVND